MRTPISFVYTDLIEASLKTGITYKTFEQVPDKIKKEVKKILVTKSIEVKNYLENMRGPLLCSQFFTRVYIFLYTKT